MTREIFLPLLITQALQDTSLLIMWCQQA